VISRQLDYELVEGVVHPYDTHPSLRERIAALQNRQWEEIPGDKRSAMSLLDNVEECEIRLISALTIARNAQALPLVAWDEVGQKIWLPVWADYTKKRRKILAGITACTLPEVVQNLEVYARRHRAYDARDLTPEQRYQEVTALMSTALAVALHQDSWKLLTLPGDDVICERKGTVLKPFDIIPQLVTGEITPAAWQAFCATADIADLALDGGATTPQEGSVEQRADKERAPDWKI
jgi:hypothetical protein